MIYNFGKSSAMALSTHPKKAGGERVLPLQQMCLFQKFMRSTNENGGTNLDRYNALHDRSVAPDTAQRMRTIRDAMISHGVGLGDKVAVVMSNSIVAMTICLFVLPVGAIRSSASCELGIQSITERSRQIKPKLVFADDGYWYGGKLIMLVNRIREWSYKLAGAAVSEVLVVPYYNLTLNRSRIYYSKTIRIFLASGMGCQLAFLALPFSHPAYIIYSTGTVNP
jgi:acetoacetyl-CoA synthetase